MSNKTGAWLNIIPSKINGTDLSVMEFRERLHQTYNYNLSEMCKKCLRCRAKFIFAHALGYKKGGLIKMRHDEINNDLVELLSQDLIPSTVNKEPLIHPSPTATNVSWKQEN